MEKWGQASAAAESCSESGMVLLLCSVSSPQCLQPGFLTSQLSCSDVSACSPVCTLTLWFLRARHWLHSELKGAPPPPPRQSFSHLVPVHGPSQAGRLPRGLAAPPLPLGSHGLSALLFPGLGSLVGCRACQSFTDPVSKKGVWMGEEGWAPLG